jgi:hypothetical protein
MSHLASCHSADGSGELVAVQLCDVAVADIDVDRVAGHVSPGFAKGSKGVRQAADGTRQGGSGVVSGARSGQRSGDTWTRQAERIRSRDAERQGGRGERGALLKRPSICCGARADWFRMSSRLGMVLLQRFCPIRPSLNNWHNRGCSSSKGCERITSPCSRSMTG